MLNLKSMSQFSGMLIDSMKKKYDYLYFFILAIASFFFIIRFTPFLDKLFFVKAGDIHDNFIIPLIIRKIINKTIARKLVNMANISNNPQLLSLPKSNKMKTRKAIKEPMKGINGMRIAYLSPLSLRSLIIEKRSPPTTANKNTGIINITNKVTNP